MRSASLYTLLFILSVFFISAARAATPEALLHFQRGNAYYERARFDSAALEYEAVLADSLCSDALYYNLGNAYYRMQQYPLAILSYERALKLNPNNENAEFNLTLARTFTVDKIESPEVFPLRKAWNNFLNIFGATTWTIIAFVALVLSLLSVFFLRFLVSRDLLRRLLFVPIVMGVIALTSVVLSLYTQARYDTRDTAIIMKSVVSVKSSPDAGAKDLFILHAGTKVNVLQQIGDWYEVSIANGKQGWIETMIVQRI